MFEVRYEVWNESESVRLLQQVGAKVADFEAMGARIPQREMYHTRLIAAHDAQDMDAYRAALHGYMAAAREACRKVNTKSKQGG